MSKQFSIHLPEDLHKKAKSQAALMGISLSEFLSKIIQDQLKRSGAQDPKVNVEIITK